MTDREILWREIRTAASDYEAPSHLSDSQLLAIAKRLSPAGPSYFDACEAWGIDRESYIASQDGHDI